MGNIGLIPAAGRGTRAYPYTKWIPKTMFKVAGKPVLQKNIEIMRDKLNVDKIYIIVGHIKGSIKDYFGDGSDFGVQIEYIEQKKRKGIGHAILQCEDKISKENKHFFVILGDEVYIDSNHQDMLRFMDFKYDVICCFKETYNMENIKKNYSADLDDCRIIRLTEKPAETKNNLIGCGTYVFSPRIFEYIKKTKPSSLRNEVEVADVINNMIGDGLNAHAFLLKGDYVNINRLEDYHIANYMLRNRDFSGYKKSLIIPAYNEELSIKKVIDDFKPLVDEILVVNNNCTDNTEKIALECGARVVRESKKGYGHALKRGMSEAKGDILILTEADYSLRSKDLGKLMEYLKDCDMVVGTRTTRQMIEQGANMDWFLRWGNVFLGKFLETLYWSKEPRFTDVGCTYRAIWKEDFELIKDNLDSAGPEFSPEMIIEAIKAKKRVIEVPVSYYKRFGGESKHTKNFMKSLKVGLSMMSLIIRKT